MIIRVAETADFEDIMQFYYHLIDNMQNAEFHPGWEKDIYPTRYFIQESIKQGELVVAVIEKHIVSAMVINHDCAEGYIKAGWRVDAAPDAVGIIHVLGISPLHQGKGIAKKMLAYAVDACRQKKLKAIRLDVLASNLPAQNLYAGFGFVYIDTIQLFYEDTGLTDYLLYEMALE